MTKAPKAPKPTRAELQRKLIEMESQLAHAYHFADAYLDKASNARCMGGGVMLELTASGGRKIIDPVMIKDGLSPETIEAIRKDLVRSYELAVMFKPKGVS